MAGGSVPARHGRALGLVRSALLDRLPLKAVALFFAFVLWLAVSADEPGEQTVAVRLALRIDSSLTLAGGEPRLTATVTGRRRDLLKLRGGDPVLRRTIAVAGADSVRLVLRPADVELPPGAEGDVRVRDVQPRRLTLRFVSAHRARAALPAQSRAALPPPAAAAVAGAAPAELAAGDSVSAARAPDTLWQAGAGGVAPREAAGPASAARRGPRRAPRVDSAPAGPPPEFIILPSDSATVIDTLPTGAARRARSRSGVGRGAAGRSAPESRSVGATPSRGPGR